LTQERKGKNNVKSQLVSFSLALGALILGGIIGLAFGSLQNAALLRYRKLQQNGASMSGSPIMQGSATRIAFLLVGLVVVQIACPMFFDREGMQWIVSAGVVLGYGWTLLDQFRLRSTQQL
jgi:hypothetical protein